MPHDPSKELSLYFHIDPQLARGRDCVHLHVLLEDSQTAKRLSLQKPWPAPTLPFIQFCVPPNGNEEQKVRAVSGATTGTICCIGRGTVNASHPTEVRGKIYASGQGVHAPDNPPDPSVDPSVKIAQLVNCPSHPNFSTTLCGISIEPNFVFNQTYANVIPAAKCSTTGESNDLVLWLKYAGTWYKYAPQPFKGVCATTTECGDSTGFGGSPTATVLLAGPMTLKVVSPGPSPKAGTVFTLHRTGEECASMVTWQSCPKSNPECQWKLWLKSNAGKPFATLALLAADGKRLPVPLVWKCLDWDPDAETQFTASSPSGSKQERTTARVSPG